MRNTNNDPSSLEAKQAELIDAAICMFDIVPSTEHLDTLSHMLSVFITSKDAETMDHEDLQTYSLVITRLMADISKISHIVQAIETIQFSNLKKVP